MRSSANRLIVFFVPPKKIVNGGVMSIFSLCKESRRFHAIHKSDVILCTYPGTLSYKKNDLFENEERVYSFQEIVESYPKLDSLVLQLPEVALEVFCSGIVQYEDYLKSIKDLRINIMNQNIQHMPDQGTVASLYRYTSNITQTTAHDRYATQEVCDKYGVPLHHLSVFIDSGQYTRTNYVDKKDIIAYSPDKHPSKHEIIEKIKAQLKTYELVEINNLSYEEYKELIRNAKFILTFGEGFDGYFIEAIFSGSISLAVYNEEFFPSADFKKYSNIYKDYGHMLNNICNDIERLDNTSTYSKLNDQLYEKLEGIYSFNNYLKNLESFYRGNYSYTPSPGSLEKFFIKAIKQKDLVIEAANYEPGEINNILQQREELKDAVRFKDDIISSIYKSNSWKITKPLRLANDLVHKIVKRNRA